LQIKYEFIYKCSLVQFMTKQYLWWWWQHSFRIAH